MGILNTNDYREVSMLMAAIAAQFSCGSQSVALAQGGEIIGTVLSRAASEKALARETAELWMAHPEMLEELESSLEETPEPWD